MSEEAILRRIQGLLNLADNNPSKEEAAAAMAKATALMEEHNLTAAAVERAKGVDGKREDKYVVGGQYRWQRDLWGEVAKLHFCLYWTQQYRTVREVAYTVTHLGMHYPKGSPVMRKRHRLVDRPHNVASARHMAEYLELTINRILRARLTDSAGAFNWKDFNGGWGTAFREGMASEIMGKLAERRRQTVAKKPRVDAFGGTALVLSTYIDEETDKNMEFVYGKETVQKMREKAQADRRAQQAYTAWATTNPDAAAKEWRWTDPVTGRDYVAGKPSYKADPRDRDRDWGAYRAGQEAGEKVSIDPQAEGVAKRTAIAGKKDIHL